MLVGAAVYADGGICLDILQNQWSPIYDVSAILTSIQVRSAPLLGTLRGLMRMLFTLKLGSLDGVLRHDWLPSTMSLTPGMVALQLYHDQHAPAVASAGL
jgi:hypothetical protein